MSGYRLPAPIGKRIDRTQPVTFTFNGRHAKGFAGDTVASALLAEGFRRIGRSFKLHRPRGIFSCGEEDPIGLLDIGDDAHRVPNTRATDFLIREGLSAKSNNCWPSVDFDLMSINSLLADFIPSGFYYKTFIWPNWHLYEPMIRLMTGLGRVGDGSDPDSYDEVSEVVDLLVIGGGVCGMQAALTATQAGRRVLLLEAEGDVGGWLDAQIVADADQPLVDVAGMKSALLAAGAEIRTRTTALAIHDHKLVIAIESMESSGRLSGTRERLWKLRAKQIILATGAYERPMLFPDNDRPGVMLAGAVARYASHYGVSCGHRVAVVTACDAGYKVAQTLKLAGIDVAAIIDRRGPDARTKKMTKSLEIEVLSDSVVIGVDGRSSVHGIRVAPLAGGKAISINADVVASSGGYIPNVNLYSQAGGSLDWINEMAMFVPRGQISGISVVGACAGVFHLLDGLAHAEVVGRVKPGEPGPSAPVSRRENIPADTRPPAAALKSLNRRAGKQFVDLQNDVTSADVELAAREGYRSVEHLKRYTTAGMGTDQGKTSNVNALVVLGSATERTPSEVGTTKFRPPFKPVTISAISGGRHGDRYRPRKLMPGHLWHERRGAIFEEYGGWMRPAAYPNTGETLEQAARRECSHVRRAVGIFEGSPLGKIEIVGPDAATFLDLMYLGTMSTLVIGQARYGVLLSEMGIVVDDGIVARMGEMHYWINTTSGGVDRTVMAFEEWHQCEFPHLQVAIQPVTSQWGNVTVAGPGAWKLLEITGFDASLAPAEMKHMTIRKVRFGDIPMRVMRASFSGELGYEINVPARYEEALLERLWECNSLDICTYGVEALQIMRIEKGYIHIGTDTDGTTLPSDIGLGRGIEKKRAEFVGRRSLFRPVARDANRMKLVGFEPLDRRTFLPVGSHVTNVSPPAEIDGYVTSSCFSPTLGRPISLGMLRSGHTRHGETIRISHMGTCIDALVTSPQFLDAGGERLNG